MTQITSGFRRVLSIAAVYNCLQIILGTRQSKARLVKEFFKVSPGQRLLDVGCGTGLILDYLPASVEYVGIDDSRDYIDHARSRYGNRGKFIHQRADEAFAEDHQPFDRVIAVGLLHHLSDDEAEQLFKVSQTLLATGSGEFHSIDPCYTNHQSRISRFLIDRDRGQNVRTVGGYEALARRVFRNVAVSHRNDMLKVPYDHTIMRCY